MLKGIYLTLLAGPATPRPVSAAVLDALSGIQITTAAGTRSGFQLTFTFGKNSPLDGTFLLDGGNIVPMMRIIIVVTINSVPEVLMDGVMTRHEVAPSNEPGQSTLTVTGEDLTALMDLEDHSGTPYPAMAPEARVAQIVGRYASYGLVPRVMPSVVRDVPSQNERIPRQQGTDLQYIQQLAADAGHVFYLEPGPAPGASTAYWGPEVKRGTPQPALTVNLDAANTVETLNFSFDTDAKTQPVVFMQDRSSKEPRQIPVSDITPLNPPLGRLIPAPRRIRPINLAAKLSAGEAQLIGTARAATSADIVSASGTLDVLRYGRPLRARSLVGVRGAGQTYDGLYYVKNVTHTIRRGEYKQNFTLSRNGLVSTLARIPV
jgi:hypothetical protein